MSILLKFLRKSAAINTEKRAVQENSLKNNGLGYKGEEIACDFLKERGFSIIERNFSCRGGEIDIIAEKDGEIHFVEVKTRTAASHESPLESVTPKKRKRVRRAAEMWLAVRRKNIKPDDLQQCYLSVIGLDMSGEWPEIEFVEDAFV